MALVKRDNPKVMLDVATGTADVAIMAAKLVGPNKIIGIDISAGMLEVGKKKVQQAGLEEKIELQVGDSESIHFPDNHFDAVTVSFGVRNFQSLEYGLSEILRVLKPGARLVVLEFSRPSLPGVQQAYNLYMSIVAPQMVSIFSKNRKAYQYLNDSVQKFPEGKDFTAVMDRCGFKETSCKRLSLGICSIYTGIK